MDEKELLGQYKLVLGLEIHLHLKTKHKMFCGDDADIYNAEPNTHVCPVCLGLPGALPVPNFDAVHKAQLLGLALNCKLNKDTKFDRKHYFYPDLPKGYQISQYKQPLCGEGYLVLESGKRVEIERVHMEEDVAKSFHEKEKTLIDFNKSGMPLVEIVTKPVFTNTSDAVEFSKKIQQIVRYLGIGDVDMEKGQMRLEANISLRTLEMEEKDELMKYKVEVKNINSFRFMERAVRAEIVRQRALLEKGEMPIQENRGYNEDKNVTVSQREKEEAHDYRYFPEPDIPPMVFDDKYFVDLRTKLVELPWQRKNRLVEMGVIPAAADVLTMAVNKDIYDKFEQLIKNGIGAKKAANIVVNKKESRNMTVEEIVATLKSSEDMVENIEELEEIISKVLLLNKDAVLNYKNGKVAVFEFLVGQIMRETKGRATSTTVRELLKSHLIASF